METNAKQQVVERVKAANNVLVTVSTSPTVDQLASAIGFTLLLNKLGKHSTTVFSGEVPAAIDFLQPEKTIEKTTDSLRDFIISLDKAKADKLRYKVEDEMVKIFITPYRTSITERDLEFGQGDFNVDVVIALGVLSRDELDQAIMAHGRILHDATVISLMAGEQASNLGSINWQDGAASSLCEMLVSISEAFGSGLLDTQIATSFLTGIVAETERFKNDKTTPKVLTMSAQLVAAGANQQLIATELEAPPPPPPPPPAEPEFPPVPEKVYMPPENADGQSQSEQPAEPAPEPEKPRTEVDVSLTHEEPNIGFDMPDEPEEPADAPQAPSSDELPALDYSVHDDQSDNQSADQPEQSDKPEQPAEPEQSTEEQATENKPSEQPDQPEEHHEDQPTSLSSLVEQPPEASREDQPAEAPAEASRSHVRAGQPAEQDQPAEPGAAPADDQPETPPAPAAEPQPEPEPEPAPPAEPEQPAEAPDLGLIEISHDAPAQPEDPNGVSPIQIDEHGNIMPGTGYEITPPPQTADAPDFQVPPQPDQPPAPTSGMPDMNLAPSDSLGPNAGPADSAVNRGFLPPQTDGGQAGPAMSGAMEDSRTDPSDAADILNLPPLDGRMPQAAPQPSITSNTSPESLIQPLTPPTGQKVETLDDARSAVLNAIGTAPFDETHPDPIQALNAAPLPDVPHDAPQAPAPDEVAQPVQYPQPVMPPMMGVPPPMMGTPPPNIVTPTPGGAPPATPPPIMPPIITNHRGPGMNLNLPPSAPPPQPPM